MNTIEIIFTVINICLTAVSVSCAIFAAKQTRTQTKLMEKQIELSQEPDYALSSHLDSIKRSIYQVSDSIKELK
ncbi:MAG TPA: hypothetical protein DDX70_11460 [Bacteroides sp.]|nr:hypothetical protein [Bacteroides sp.]